MFNPAFYEDKERIKEIEGEMWKGKADSVNHNEKLVIDLKTTADITKFKWSASKYNYDSQAYIYSELFGYEMIFIEYPMCVKKWILISEFSKIFHFVNYLNDWVEKL